MTSQVGFTGTRNGMTDAQKARVEWLLLIFDALHHGDCLGADAEAHALAIEWGLRTVAHPPRWHTLRAFCACDEVREADEYLARNHSIVDETGMLIAAPGEMEEQLRSGTWSTVRYAQAIGRRVLIVFPDGCFREIPAAAREAAAQS